MGLGGGTKGQRLNGQRLDGLDGLRGFAALVVVPYHTITGMRPDTIPFLVGTPLFRMEASDPWITKLWLTIFNGESAVLLFFILSGFVLTRSLVDDFRHYPVVTATMAFVVRRLLRIFPSLLACLIAIYALSNAAHALIPAADISFSGAQLLANAALIDFPLNGATWTLQVEMLAIPVMVVAGLLTGRWGVAGAVAALIAAFVVMRSGQLNFGFLFLVIFQFYFVAGALAWALSARQSENTRSFVPWWAILAAFMFVNQLAISPTLAFYLRAGLAGWLVAVLATSPSRVLQHRASVFLGKISYSFYLWNVLFMNLLFSFRDDFPPWMAQHQALSGLLLAIPIVIATIPLANFVYKHVERPGMALGKKWSDRILAQSIASRANEDVEMTPRSPQ